MSENTITQDQELSGTDQENVNGQNTDQDTKPDLTQCENLSPKGRRCKLAPGHDGDHRYVIRENAVKAPTLKELRASDAQKFGKFSLVAEVIPAKADVSRQYKREIERDEDQLKVDSEAKKMYDRWVKKGSPKGSFEDLAPALGSRYIVPPEAFNTVIDMLRRATQTGAATQGKQLAYRRGEHESGNTIINWMIVDHGTFPKKSDGSES